MKKHFIALAPLYLVLWLLLGYCYGFAKATLTLAIATLAVVGICAWFYCVARRFYDD